MSQCHAIYIKYLGPTNHSGSRVKLTCYDVSHRNGDKPKSIIIGYRYEFNDINDMALDHINRSGVSLELVGYNNRAPDCNVMLFKWNFEQICKLFKIKMED